MFCVSTGSLAKRFTPEAKNKYTTSGKTNSIARTMYFFITRSEIPAHKSVKHHIVNIIGLDEQYKNKVWNKDQKG